MKIPRCDTLRLVLGDQLNAAHSWFEHCDDEVLYVIAELHQEAGYVRHHVQKIAAFFLAMSAFAEALRKRGHRVLHLDLDATADFENLPALLGHLLEHTGASCFEYQRPDELRLLKQLERACETMEVPTRRLETEHFLLDFDELGKQFSAGKAHRMEPFYRRMRQRLGVLLDADGEPEGGRWNYDRENRDALPADQALPEPMLFANDAAETLGRIERHQVKTIGRIEGAQVHWPVTREQSLEQLEWFVREALPGFGPYQDALTDRGWALFHSRLSFSLNSKLLHPAEVVDAVVAAWREGDAVSLASAEGYIRQIIGWREYMRGMYWANMPGLAETNFFDHDRALPSWFWSGETDMACMRQAIGQSLDHAYAHHIQRLMVTGNFCLLAGIDPDAVDAWYLGIYADAIEWVELPNTRGMSQFADGGLIASKPYAASGQYIKRMGDHCANCAYDVARRSGPRACPFNSLYWHFMNRHREHIADNPRIAVLFRNWDRMDEARRAAILETAQRRLENIEDL